jgi:hypothetical protein
LAPADTVDRVIFTSSLSVVAVSANTRHLAVSVIDTGLVLSDRDLFTADVEVIGDGHVVDRLALSEVRRAHGELTARDVDEVEDGAVR